MVSIGCVVLRWLRGGRLTRGEMKEVKGRSKNEIGTRRQKVMKK
ncbi:ubiquitin, putative [Trypanosoma brucei gambiense DAL972]|uniref:Ubiquitin, putative n=1 Tax=Trypanosoma brucei gambiense (strain MHOM/CI/86/DAL972) TaxID=679716 RepID=C9ZMP6_TRYB9|nr:ubiquitin, putative [Trypanosoma brucei gambiense DAL972]CBH10549.1 ubiquitin, putative [Trypanosoma brucei gambiense DAL972]|eukprot:XP_011772838.1 ubiquitin, putative [Trypanosoma brucei gambiense DAL972]